MEDEDYNSIVEKFETIPEWTWDPRLQVRFLDRVRMKEVKKVEEDKYFGETMNVLVDRCVAWAVRLPKFDCLNARLVDLPKDTDWKVEKYELHFVKEIWIPLLAGLPDAKDSLTNFLDSLMKSTEKVDRLNLDNAVNETVNATIESALFCRCATSDMMLRAENVDLIVNFMERPEDLPKMSLLIRDTVLKQEEIKQSLQQFLGAKATWEVFIPKFKDFMKRLEPAIPTTSAVSESAEFYCQYKDELPAELQSEFEEPIKTYEDTQTQ